MEAWRAEWRDGLRSANYGAASESADRRILINAEECSLRTSVLGHRKYAINKIRTNC